MIPLQWIEFRRRIASGEQIKVPIPVGVSVIDVELVRYLSHWFLYSIESYNTIRVAVFKRDIK